MSMSTSGSRKKYSQGVKLQPVNTKNRRELEELHAFIRSFHSAPKKIQPTREDLKRADHRYFWAIATAPEDMRSRVIGITSYEIRTRFLVETQKTIVAPEFRDQGWGKLISQVIEERIRKLGFKKIRSTIYSTNLTMIAIKLAQGYTIEGFHPDHEAPGLHEYSLGKLLK